MITKVIEIDGSEHAIRPNGDIRKVATYYGMDADVVGNTISGITDALDPDRFYTKDTKRLFIYDEDAAVWLEQ